MLVIDGLDMGQQGLSDTLRWEVLTKVHHVKPRILQAKLTVLSTSSTCTRSRGRTPRHVVTLGGVLLATYLIL